MQIRMHYRLEYYITALIFVILVNSPGKLSFADDDPKAEVLSVGNHAWVTHKGGTTKTSVKVGDALQGGSQLSVPKGHQVDIAMDDNRLNVVHVKGGTQVKFPEKMSNRIDLLQGRIFVFIDDEKSRRRFRVLTSTGAAITHGSHFQVNVSGDMTRVHDYNGSVRVYPIEEDGRFSRHYEDLEPGLKTMIRQRGQLPLPVAEMSDEELDEIIPILERIERYRDKPEPVIEPEPVAPTPPKQKPDEPQVIIDSELTF